MPLYQFGKAGRSGTSASATSGSRYQWTKSEVLGLLKADPTNSFFQYAGSRLTEQEPEVQGIAAPANRPAPRANLSLMSLFSGVSAVEESLQMDALRGDIRRQPIVSEKIEGQTRQPFEMVEVSKLSGPTTKSHPWHEMLAGKTPPISRLSQLVPADFLYLESHSLRGLLEVMESVSSWGQTISSQLTKRASENGLAERLIKQLLVSRHVVTESLEHQLSEVALVSSDLFALEGNDITLLFMSEQPDELRDSIRKEIEHATSEGGVSRHDFVFQNTEIQHLSACSLDTNVFFAEPIQGVFVRSNSLVALKRVIDCVRNGKETLGGGDEYKYVRTLMPREKSLEDVFVYLSDSFIRRLVGPELRLTEKHRGVCHKNLKLLDNAAMFHGTQNGQSVSDLQNLYENSDQKLRRQDFICPDGGEYSLGLVDSAVVGVCSIHGRSQLMTPCLEIPVTTVPSCEALEYKAFIDEYNRYWTTHFDPIAMQLKITESLYKAEILVLPLIDNSIYTQLSSFLGGPSGPLENQLVPENNIFSASANLNKSHLLMLGAAFSAGPPLPGVSSEQMKALDISGFAKDVLGDQISLNVCDSAPAFTLDISEMLGMIMPGVGRLNTSAVGQSWFIGFLAASLNAPSYLAAPVKSKSHTDRFLNDLYEMILSAFQSSTIRATATAQLYTFILGHSDSSQGYCCVVQIGPLKVRFYWARIGDVIYLASKESVLNSLVAATGDSKRRDRIAYSEPSAPGHAMVRFRCANWNEVLSDISINQAETNRCICIKNIVALSASHRVAQALGVSQSVDSGRRVCPDSGQYVEESGSVCCTVHGLAQAPRQPAHSSIKFTRDANAITAQLTFLEDGLRAKLTVDRNTHAK